MSQYKKAMAQLVMDQNYELFVTLSTNTMYPNKVVALNRLRSLFGALLARLDRKFLGPNWRRHGTEQRTQAIALAEHLDTNAHLHVMMTLPYRNIDVALLQSLFTRYWTKLVPSGDCLVGYVRDNKRGANYITKTMYDPTNADHVLIASQFHPS